MMESFCLLSMRSLKSVSGLSLGFFLPQVELISVVRPLLRLAKTLSAQSDKDGAGSLVC